MNLLVLRGVACFLMNIVIVFLIPELPWPLFTDWPALLLTAVSHYAPQGKSVCLLSQHIIHRGANLFVLP